MDPIDRQVAIDALYHVDEYNGRSIEAIRNLPSAEQRSCEYWDAESKYCALNRPSAEPRWIPVTERLPETVERFTDAENVLAHDDGTVEFFGVFTEYESDPVLVEGIAEGEHGIFTAIYSMWKYEDGAVETAWLDNIISDIEIKNVTAWMPLPEPWRGEDDD